MAKQKVKAKPKENVFRIPQSTAAKIVETVLNQGVLMWVDGGAWGNRRKVKDQLIQEAGLPIEAVRASHFLVDREEVRAVARWIDKAHTWARNNSHPWFNDAVHFLVDSTNEGLVERVEKAESFMQECLKGMNEALDDLSGKLPDLEKEFAKKYPKLYDPKYYPTPEQLRGKFRLRWGFQAIVPASGSNGKVKVLSTERWKKEELKQREMIKETLQECISATRNSFLVMIRHLKDRLDGPDKKFKDVSVEKPKKFLEEFFKSMDIFGDKPFAEVAKEAIEILEGVDGDDLRDDDEFRSAMAEATGEIVEAITALPTVEFERDIDLG